MDANDPTNFFRKYLNIEIEFETSSAEYYVTVIIPNSLMSIMSISFILLEPNDTMVTTLVKRDISKGPREKIMG